MKTIEFNPQELCSRKLWQIVNAPNTARINDDELSQAVAELAKRRRYLEELSEMGKLGETSFS
jgi:hypothetical protein